MVVEQAAMRPDDGLGRQCFIRVSGGCLVLLMVAVMSRSCEARVGYCRVLRGADY